MDTSKPQTFSKHLLKLFSFFFAVTLWFYVLNSEPLEVEKTLPLEYLLPESIAISNNYPLEVTVKMKGSRTFMRNLFSEKEKVFVDLKNARLKPNTSMEHTISDHDVPAPFGVQVLSVEPKTIELEFQKTTTRRVRVVPNLVGEVSRDLKLINTRIEPSSVKLTGPTKAMKKIKQISTVPIDLTTLTKSGILKVNLGDIDQRIKVAEDVSFSFSYEISPRKANITLKNIPIRFLTTARRYSSKHRFVSMDVLVSEDEESNLKLKNLSVVADIPDGTDGTVELPLRANLPEGVFLMKIHPETIKVFVKP